jgi:pilus assembly protein Flp/PilA
MSMLTMLHTLSAYARTRFVRDDGATAVEYGIMVALIAAVIVAAVALIGDELLDVFNEVLTALQGR